MSGQQETERAPQTSALRSLSYDCPSVEAVALGRSLHTCTLGSGQGTQDSIAASMASLLCEVADGRNPSEGPTKPGHVKLRRVPLQGVPQMADANPRLSRQRLEAHTAKYRTEVAGRSVRVTSEVELSSLVESSLEYKRIADDVADKRARLEAYETLPADWALAMARLDTLRANLVTAEETIEAKTASCLLRGTGGDQNG